MPLAFALAPLPFLMPCALALCLALVFLFTLASGETLSHMGEWNLNSPFLILRNMRPCGGQCGGECGGGGLVGGVCSGVLYLGFCGWLVDWLVCVVVLVGWFLWWWGRPSEASVWCVCALPLSWWQADWLTGPSLAYESKATDLVLVVEGRVAAHFFVCLFC